jgi:ribosome maturation factor RimP
VNGNKNFVGTLLSYENEVFRLRTDEGEELEFSQETVAKATTVYENF